MKMPKSRETRSVIALFLLVAVLITSGNYYSVYSFAYEAKTGMICKEDGLVTTRSEPSDSSSKVNGLEYGKPVTVIDEVTSGGELWYKITYRLKVDNSEKTAYCRAVDVLLDKDVQVIATGVINANNVFVRNDAGTSGTYKLTSLYMGHKVEILTQTSVSGEVWYRVRCVDNETTYIGWVFGQYITMDEYTVEPDADFEEQMRSLGFPESYINSLSVLHSKHPNWQFVPVITGLDWVTVIKEESVSSINMVQTTADDAKKSVAATEYDWNTNTWVIRDGSGWVTAHPDYIAYCMDPRNYLDETYIFQFESLSYSAAQNLAGVKAIIDNTFMEGNSSGVVNHSDGTSINYGETFVSIGKELDVSPYHLASRVRQEQGVSGTSPLISGTYSGYEGYYNYFNIGAYGTPASVLYQNGLERAKKEGWNTRYLSLKGGAKLIANKYIAVGQDTLYFQKFNVVNHASLYRHQYMANVTAAITEGKKMGSAYADKNQAFVFRIPVYKNMPASAVTFEVKGNRNNYLKSLSISGLSLTPTFNGATTSYSMVVDSSISSITVSATAVVDKATVTGTGVHSLKVGTNSVKIYCKSESGDTRTYEITVVRQEPATGPGDGSDAEYTLTSGKYKIGEQITGITPQTGAAEFLAGFSCTGGTVKLVDASGKENSGTVATGNKLEVYVGGRLVATKNIVIYGDVSGDGKINISDIVKINRHLLGLGTLSGPYLLAADVNHSGGVNISDIVITNRHLLNLTTINQ